MKASRVALVLILVIVFSLVLFNWFMEIDEDNDRSEDEVTWGTVAQYLDSLQVRQKALADSIEGRQAGGR